jgi:spondin-1
VIEHRDVWYMDEGALTKRFCEEEVDLEDSQSTILDECRACDEAKYELTFEGLWSRNTHPKDFPSNGLTKFSDVIGASHTTEYRFWMKGEQARYKGIFINLSFYKCLLRGFTCKNTFPLLPSSS